MPGPKSIEITQGLVAAHLHTVIAGRDPAIQETPASGTGLDHRVEPGDDKLAYTNLLIS
jgi:hypothetical protein